MVVDYKGPRWQETKQSVGQRSTSAGLTGHSHLGSFDVDPLPFKAHPEELAASCRPAIAAKGLPSSVDFSYLALSIVVVLVTLRYLCTHALSVRHSGPYWVQTRACCEQDD